MAIRKAPEGYGITGDIEGPTKWYSGPPIGEGGHTVSVSMSRNLFDILTTAAKVEGKTPGCVVGEASKEYAEAIIKDPEFLQKVGELAERLDKYKSNPKPNPRESE